MSMLLRYRKEGGFQQLVTLLETSSTSRRQDLFLAIQKEDPAWGALLKTKVLTTDRIFSWREDFIRKILLGLDPRTLALVVGSLESQARERALNVLGSPLREEWSEFRAEKHAPQEEIEAAHLKLIQHVRELDRKKALSLEEADPALGLTGFRTG